MSSHDYFPDDEAECPAWYGNFSRKFGSLYSDDLGLSDYSLGLQNDALMVEYLVNKYKNDFARGRTTVTNFANQMLSGEMSPPTSVLPYPVAPPYAGTMVAPGINGRTRRLVSQIKSAGGYTAEMGRDMGLVATGSDHDMTAPALEITELSGQRIKVKWLKGEADALEIFFDFGAGYPRRGERFTRTPFEMEVELPTGKTAPASATAKGRYIEDDKPTGEFGPEYPITILA